MQSFKVCNGLELRATTDFVAWPARASCAIYIVTETAMLTPRVERAPKIVENILDE
jgi:hypothetical protein